jgi:NADH:ubiquinone oxidoreductase subunit 6 (subunit J)
MSAFSLPLALADALVASTVAIGLPFLLYPLALLSGIAVVVLLGAVNTVFVLLVLRMDSQMANRRQAATPLIVGLAVAMIELAVVSLARAALEAWVGPSW